MKVGFFAVKSVGILFQKKANILMVEQENQNKWNFLLNFGIINQLQLLV